MRDPMEDVAGESEAAEALARYVAAAESAKRLTAEEEARLARMIESGRQATDSPVIPFDWQVRRAKSAKKRLVDCNLRLVMPIAKRYTGFGLGLTDLIEEGTFGLRRAAEEFDRGKAYRFSAYADTWIRGAIVRALREQGPSLDGPAGVREPRTPYPPIDSAAATAKPDHEATGPPPD